MLQKYKQIAKNGLCPKNLNNQVGIYTRGLTATTPGNVSATINLTLIDNFMCGIETIGGIEKEFSKNPNNVNTHLFFFNFSTRLFNLEPFKTFVLFRDNYYRLNSVENLNESKRVLVFATTFRGATTEDEARA